MSHESANCIEEGRLMAFICVVFSGVEFSKPPGKLRLGAGSPLLAPHVIYHSLKTHRLASCSAGLGSDVSCT